MKTDIHAQRSIGQDGLKADLRRVTCEGLFSAFGSVDDAKVKVI